MRPDPDKHGGIEVSRRIAILTVLALLLFGSATASAAEPAAPTSSQTTDPWMTKPVLPLLLLTQGDDYVAARVQFAQRANLTSLELDTLKGAGYQRSRGNYETQESL